MEPAAAPVCLNCGTPVTGPFCTACGQEHALATRLTAGLAFADVVEETVQVNKALALAALDLVIRPGLLTADFLAGRRRRHPAPGKLYLVVNFAFFVIVQWFDPVEASVVADLVGQEFYAQAQVASKLDTVAFGRAVEQRMGDALPAMLLLFVPLIAVLLRVLYSSRGLGVVAHSVFGFHLMAFLLLSFVPGTVFAGPVGDELVEVSLYATLPLWSAIALHRAYRGAWWWTLLRTGVLWFWMMMLLAAYIFGLAFYAVTSAG